MAYERKAEPIGRELVRRLLPRRDPEGHKGTFGKVLCLCGSVGYTGAPVFASRGAVRSGAGLVFLGVPESIWPVAAVKSDEAMPFPLPEAEARELRRQAAWERRGLAALRLILTVLSVRLWLLWFFLYLFACIGVEKLLALPPLAILGICFPPFLLVL